ncbi:hypothetical protein [Salana multivorans]
MTGAAGITLAQQRGVTRLVRTTAELGRSLGRADEADQLEAVLTTLTGPVVAAFTGEPGSGATSLMQVLADPVPEEESATAGAAATAGYSATEGAATAEGPATDGGSAAQAGPGDAASGVVDHAGEEPDQAGSSVLLRRGDLMLLDPGGVPRAGELGPIDLVVWTHRGDQPMRAGEMAALTEIAALRPVLVAVTMADVVPEVVVVVAEIERALATAGLAAPVLTVSAHLARLVAGLPEGVRTTAAGLAGIDALAARLRQEVQGRVIPGRYVAVLGMAIEACERVVAEQRTELDPVEQRRAQLTAEIEWLDPLAQRAGESSRRVDQMVHDSISLPRTLVEDEVRALRQRVEEQLGDSPGEEAVVEQLSAGMAEIAGRALAYQDTILATLAHTMSECFGIRPLAAGAPPGSFGPWAAPGVHLAPSAAAPSQGWIPVVLQSAGVGGLVMTVGGSLTGISGAAAAATVVAGPIGLVAGAVAIGVAAVARRRIARTAKLTARRDLTVRVREGCAEAQRQLVRVLTTRYEAVAREWRMAGAAEGLVRRVRELRRAREQVAADPRAIEQLRTAGELLSRLSAAHSSLRGIAPGAGENRPGAPGGAERDR